MCVQAASAGMKRYFSLSAFPVMEKSFLHCQQLPLPNIARNLKCLSVDYSMILSYLFLFEIPPDMSRLWGWMDYCQRCCSQDNLNVGLHTHTRTYTAQ